MATSQEFEYLPLNEITVDRASRQRSKVDPGDLVDSIKRLGVLNPIIITKQKVLIAGERRLESAKLAGLKKIPCRYYEDLTDTQTKLIELEENLKRSDLPWRDQVSAIVKLHELYRCLQPKWTQGATARAAGLNDTIVSQALRIYESFDSPKIAHAAGISAAFNILSRQDDRAAGDAMSEIMEAGAKFFDEPKPVIVDGVEQPPVVEPYVPPSSDASILLADFLDWAPSYDGQKFNFIHCDFPYGINFNTGPQSGRDKWTTYQDDPEIYWRLIRALCANLDRLMAHEGHLMFWFSMEHYTQTLETFAKLAPSLAFDRFPLVWIKTDNVGVLPDPKRGPRRIYETALIASREDRLIVKAVSNAYGAQTDKRLHPSTKPEPVLRHFFEMFCDASTRMLDPTCGSGSSLRAAESLGAKHTLGLELSEEHCTSARSALRQFRALRAISK
jgi:ParB family chromosome partitioning protein